MGALRGCFARTQTWQQAGKYVSALVREQLPEPVTSLVAGLPLDLGFRAKGRLAIDICADCRADGLSFDFACGDEVYGSCTQLREFFEESGQAYVLRVASSFMITLAPG